MKTQHLSLRNIHRIASQLPPPPTSVLAQIAALPDLPFADIKAMWKQLFGADVPTHNRQFLHKRIAHRLQEDVLRVTHPELIERNQQRMRQLLAMAKQTPVAVPSSGPMPGTLLVRTYQGVEHQVKVLADGQFEYAGQRYKSLSRIARTITGMSWSGPVFFGLKSSAKAGKA